MTGTLLNMGLVVGSLIGLIGGLALWRRVARPHAELTLAVPPTVVAPEALGSREYTHEPEPSVTATAVVETGTVCIPSTFMKYVGWVCETSTWTALELAA